MSALGLLPFPFDNATNLTGLQSGDTYDATIAAANSAILDAAGMAGGYYRVPESGNYRFLTAGGAARVRKPTTIVGPRTGVATLESGPDTAVSTSAMFYVSLAGSLTLKGNLEIKGAPTASYGTDPGFADTVATFGIHSEDACAVDIDGVKLSRWITCIKMSEGGALTALNSVVAGRVVGILGVEASGVEQSITVDNCEVALDSDNGKAVGQVHNIYSYRGLDLSVTRSRFTRAGSGTYPGYGILAGYGGSGTPTRQRVISDCSFSGMSRPVYAGSTGSTSVKKSHFDCSADAFGVIQFTPAGTFEAEGLNFIGPTSLLSTYAVLDDQNTSAAGTFTNCVTSGQYVYVLRRVSSGAAGYIYWIGGTLGAPYSGQTTLGSDSGCGTLVVQDADFGQTAGNLADNHSNPRAICINCTRGGTNLFSGLG